MSNRRRSISRNTRPRSVKIPISFLHASARERAGFVDSFTVDSRRRYPYRAAGDVSPPPLRFSNGQCISAGRAAKSLSSLSGAISRVGTRKEKGRETGSRRQRSGYLPIRWIDNARKARRKSCGRGGKRVSITIDEPRCRFDHYRAVAAR